MDEIKKETKIFIETKENENRTIQKLQDSVKAVKRDIHTNTRLPQETRETSNNLTLYLKQLERKEKITPKLVEEKK